MRSGLTLTLCLIAQGCARATSDQTSAGAAAIPAGGFSSANPFAQPSSLPYQAPAFNHIRNADYQPAIEEGMRRQRAELDSIARQQAPPTFENTIVALERTGDLLNRALKVFGAVVQANTNDTLQRVQTEEAPKLAAHSDARYLDARLFQRVHSVYQRRATLNLSPEQNTLVERYHLDFVRAGAQLPESAKDRLRQLNQEEARLSTSFQNKLLAAAKAGALVLDNRSELKGLSEGEVAASAEAAKERGLAGKYLIALQNTTQQPALASLEDRGVRQRLFEASIHRAERGDSNDTRAIVRRLAALRIERANLLGFPTFAGYALDDQMAKTPDAAIDLVSHLVPPATRKARAEAAKMQALIDGQKGGFKLAPWDWQFYAEQVRKAEYDLDESQLKPYFALDHVLQDGVFYAATQLYGITFKERKDIPVYQPDVRVFEVFDADGKPLALFYARLLQARQQARRRLDGQLRGPVETAGHEAGRLQRCNFTKPAPGKPALLTFGDVTTMFHEFGHALHGHVRRRPVSAPVGHGVPRDFVEFPSQFNEHWAAGAERVRPLREALQDRRPDAAGAGREDQEGAHLQPGIRDHGIPGRRAARYGLAHAAAGTPEQDVESFERQALARYHVDLPEVPPRYRTPYFAHIWGGGYSAATTPICGARCSTTTPMPGSTSTAA